MARFYLPYFENPIGSLNLGSISISGDTTCKLTKSVNIVPNIIYEN